MDHRSATLSNAHPELLDELQAGFEARSARGRGRIVFLAGAEGSGQLQLLEDLGERLSALTPEPLVPDIARAPDSSAGRDVAQEAATILEGTLSAAGTFNPILSVIAGVIGASSAATELARKWRADSKNPMAMLPRVLETAARSRPVVIRVADVDEIPGSWWTDLVAAAGVIAREQPLWLFIAVPGTSRIPSDGSDDEPDWLVAARLLERADAADWRCIPPLGASSLARWLGIGDERVADSLSSLSGGLADVAADLLDGWRADGLIALDGTGAFILDDAVDPMALDAGVRGSYLRGQMPEASREDIDLARRLLGAGALWGRRFPVEIVAESVGADPDVAIDLLDDHLCSSPDGTPGLLREDGVVQLAADGRPRRLWFYAFEDPAAMRRWRRIGLTPGEQQAAAAQLLTDGAQLENVLGGPQRAARTFARLARTAGDQEQARHHQHVGDTEIESAVVRWQTTAVLEHPGDPSGTAALHQAYRRLRRGVEERISSDRAAEALEIVECWQSLADRRGPASERLVMLRYRALTLMEAGKLDEAQAAAELHVRTARASSPANRLAEADGLSRQSLIAWRQGRRDDARKLSDQTIQIARAHGDRWLEANETLHLADYAEQTGALDEARGHVERARALVKSVHAPRLTADFKYTEARVALESGDFLHSDRLIADALAKVDELGDLIGVFRIQELAVGCASDSGDFALARHRYRHVVDLIARHPHLALDGQVMAFHLAAARGDYAAALVCRDAILESAATHGSEVEEIAALADIAVRVLRAEAIPDLDLPKLHEIIGHGTNTTVLLATVIVDRLAETGGSPEELRPRLATILEQERERGGHRRELQIRRRLALLDVKLSGNAMSAIAKSRDQLLAVSADARRLGAHLIDVQAAWDRLRLASLQSDLPRIMTDADAVIARATALEASGSAAVMRLEYADWLTAGDPVTARRQAEAALEWFVAADDPVNEAHALAALERIGARLNEETPAQAGVSEKLRD